MKNTILIEIIPMNKWHLPLLSIEVPRALLNGLSFVQKNILNACNIFSMPENIFYKI